MCPVHRLLVRIIPFSVLVIELGITATIPAQEFEANKSDTALPFPPVPFVHAIMKAPVRAPRKLHHRWLNSNTFSIAALVAGEAVDSWGTYRNLSHTKWICGNSPAFAGDYDTNVSGEISSSRDVQNACGLGPAGQSANWAFDVTQAGYFSEGGWVTQLHLAGNRNYAAVEGWNLANDVGWYLIARRLSKRKDWIGKFGPALNFGRGIVHLDLGIGNFIAVSHHQNPNTLNLHVPADSNFTAPRWWGRR
jgi:hypothetical protein